MSSIQFSGDWNYSEITSTLPGRLSRISHNPSCIQTMNRRGEKQLARSFLPSPCICQCIEWLYRCPPHYRRHSLHIEKWTSPVLSPGLFQIGQQPLYIFPL